MPPLQAGFGCPLPLLLHLLLLPVVLPAVIVEALA